LTNIAIVYLSLNLLGVRAQPIYCQLWFRGQSEPQVTNGSIQDSLLYNEQPKPFLFHCPIFKSHHHETPEAVSLALEPCGAAGNNLRVIYNRLAENETKKDFAVCVKGWSSGLSYYLLLELTRSFSTSWTSTPMLQRFLTITRWGGGWI